MQQATINRASPRPQKTTRQNKTMPTPNPTRKHPTKTETTNMKKSTIKPSLKEGFRVLSIACMTDLDFKSDDSTHLLDYASLFKNFRSRTFYYPAEADVGIPKKPEDKKEGAIISDMLLRRKR